MDVDRFLDMEKRTGVKNADIDDFLRKVNAVQDAIQGMKDGTVDPDAVEIEGVETPEQKARKDAERKRREAERQAKLEAKRLQQKAEEKERWWRGAELMVEAHVPHDEEDEAGEPLTQAQQQSRGLLARYSNDYSRWSADIMDDPAGVAERVEADAAREKVECDQFEQANPDFCNQYKEDAEKRRKSQQKQAETANALRLKGNRYFKAKRFKEALGFYMDSLKSKPYTSATLTNVCQAHLKIHEFEDALEFADRAIFLDGTNVKARSRRAFTLKAMGRLDEALVEARAALAQAPDNSEVQRQVRELELELGDRDREARVANAVAAEEQMTAAAALPTAGAAAKRPKGKARKANKTNTSAAAPLVSPTGLDQPPEAAAAAAMAAALLNPTPPGDNTAAAAPPLSHFATIDKIIADLKQGKEEAETGAPLLDALALILATSEGARVYMRSAPHRGLRYLCQRLCGGGVAQPSAAFGVLTERPDGGGFDAADLPDASDAPLEPLDRADPTPHRTLVAIAAAVHGERLSQRIAVDQGVLDAAGHFTAAAHSTEVRLAAVRLLAEMIGDELDGTGIKRKICSSAVAARGIVDLLPTSPLPRRGTDPVAFELAAGLVRDLAADTACRCKLMQLPASGPSPATGVIPRLAEALVATSVRPGQYGAGREGCAGALANLALDEDTRPALAVYASASAATAAGGGAAANADGGGSSAAPAGGGKVMPVLALLQVVRGAAAETPAAQAFALAALMNACVERSGAVREAAIKGGGLVVALKAVAAPGSGSKVPDVLRVRSAGLLARLAAQPSSASSLRAGKAFEALSEALRRNSDLSGENVAGTLQWVKEERDHLVRVLALTLSAPSANENVSQTTSQAELIAALEARGVLAALVSFLPTPATDGRGRVTAESVVQPPPREAKVSFKLCGNVVKCFVPVVNEPSSPAAQQLYAAGLLERLVSLLSNTKETAVRKNVAIVIAKAMRHPPANTRIRELRGMEMLMQLGPQIA